MRPNDPYLYLFLKKTIFVGTISGSAIVAVARATERKDNQRNASSHVRETNETQASAFGMHKLIELMGLKVFCLNSINKQYTF
jgi:hypothetical protein